jgi:hypothetical protein
MTATAATIQTGRVIAGCAYLFPQPLFLLGRVQVGEQADAEHQR